MSISSNHSHPGPIQALLQHPKIWRASFLASNHSRHKATSSAIPSGFTTLDHHLSGGWPIGCLTEVNHGPTGIGELSLILPALAHLSAQCTQPIAWIQPILPETFTQQLNPRALSAQGLHLQQLLWITPNTLDDALWAAEQCLNSTGCCATLLWLPATSSLPKSAGFYRALQKLQIAAQRTQQWGLIIRAGRTNADKLGHAPAPLRLHIQPAQGALQIQILKRPQGWPVAPFTIHLPSQKTRTQHYWHWQHLDWGPSLEGNTSRESHASRKSRPSHESHKNMQKIAPKHPIPPSFSTQNTPASTGGPSSGA